MQHDNGNNIEWDGRERRVRERRTTYISEDSNSLTGLKLSLKELIGLLAILASLVGAWMNLDKSQATIQIKHEELIKSNEQRFEDIISKINEITKKEEDLETDKIRELHNRLDDLERITSILYEESLKRKNK